MRSSSREKNSSTYLKHFTDSGFFFSFSLVFFFFFIFFGKCLFTLLVTQNVCCTKSSQPFCCLGDTKTLILTKFENLNFILNIFQETRFLSFYWPSNYLYLFLTTIFRHFRDQRNVRHSTSKLLKCDLVLSFWTLVCGILLLGRHLLFRFEILKFLFDKFLRGLQPFLDNNVSIW